MQVESVYEAMERLKPKRMVVTECGHAYRATVLEGPYWAGIKEGKTPAQLAIAWVLRRPEVTSAIVGTRRPEQIEETANE